MAVYFVDPLEGSDSNDGLSWAQPWATTHPLVALYGSLTFVNDLEVRFAKSVPIETNRTIQMVAPTNTSYIKAGGVARPMTGFCKQVMTVYSEYMDVSGVGGSIISPFTSPGNYSYYSFGGWKVRVQAPPATNGLAVRWPISGGVDFSTFDCFETVAAFEMVVPQRPTIEDPCDARAWLEFATDSAGTNIVWSREILAGSRRTTAKLCTIGSGDLPSNAPYAFVRIDNPHNSGVWLYLSSIWAVLPVTHINYWGYRLLYVPNDKFGLTLSPLSTTNDKATTWFNGCDGPGIDSRRTLLLEQNRTWSTYTWVPFPYNAEAILRFCKKAGTAHVPLKFIGGWDKTTNTVDGITVLDAANVRLFNDVSDVSLDIRNLGLTFVRSGRDKTAYSGVCGVLETAALPGKKISACYAENVYIPANGLGTVNENVSTDYDSLAKGALLSSSVYDADSTASFKGCNTHMSVPFVGNMLVYGTVEDSTWGMAGPTIDPNSQAIFNRCTVIGAAYPQVFNGARNAPTYYDCDIVSTSLSNKFSADGLISSPVGFLENCRLWGALTGPADHTYKASGLVFYPLPGLLHAVCRGLDVDGFLCQQQPDALGTSQYPMFLTDAVRIRNGNIYLHFKCLLGDGVSTSPKRSTLVADLSNVTLHKTLSNTSVSPFAGISLTASNLTMSGPWASVLYGYIDTVDIDTLIIEDANTKVVNNFSFTGPGIGWGRVSCSIKNLIHPTGVSGAIGTPISGYVGASAACWMSAQDGEVWLTDVLSVRKDTSMPYSGMSSWRMTALRPAGSASRAGFMVGAIPVVAGLKITFSAYMRRDSMDAIGCLLIRPGATRQFPAPTEAGTELYTDTLAYQDATMLPDNWELVSAEYTPYSDGLVEVHVGMRGMPGTNVWVDSLQVS